MFEIHTPRLRLIPLNLENLLLLKENRAAMEKNLDLAVSQQVIDPHIQAELADAIDFWIVKVSQNEDNYPWFTNWEMVLKEKNIAIGGIGLTGTPDEYGQVMVGYGLDKNYHNQGFATESLQALIQWVFEHPLATSIIAETKADNLASQRVLSKNGFVQIDWKEDLMLWKLERKTQNLV
jgi:[ribosomal protein S5]-alanine N-acetyltransferase